MNALPATIAFVGLPGSGKSTIGKQLAKRLDARFFDSDNVIEQRIGMSIREFFESEGEVAFRDVEQEVIAELTKNEGCVLSTGGGVVLRQTNRENLRLRCHAIYLHTVPQEVYKRLRHDRNRPLLQVADPLARLGELYATRDPLYRESAQFVVETGRPSVSTLVYTILMQLELAGFVPAHR